MAVMVIEVFQVALVPYTPHQVSEALIQAHQDLVQVNHSLGTRRRIHPHLMHSPVASTQVPNHSSVQFTVTLEQCLSIEESIKSLCALIILFYFY